MIVVVANRQDQVAQALVSRWAVHGAGLLTCADLSLSGWHYPLSTTRNATAVIRGQIMPVDEITAVFTRLPCVFDQELIDIVPGDRAYVAAEMTAFLLSWLSRLTCPVLNRPTPTCLSGPYWRQERWVYAAAQIGIPVQPVQRRAVLPHDHPAEPPDDGSVTVIVVGKQCLGEVDKTLATQARRLADVAQTDLLAVRFSSAESGATFISADAWPDALAEGATDAILAYLQGGSKEGS